MLGSVVRPLLTWRRAELAEIVAAAGLSPVRDPSNVDDRYDRARLRKAAAGADWLDVGRWSRIATALAEAEDALTWLVRRLYEDRVERGEFGLKLTLMGEPPEVVRRLVTACLVRLRPEAVLRGGEVRSLVGRLLAATPDGPPVSATLAGVLVIARSDGPRLALGFGPAPPRMPREPRAT